MGMEMMGITLKNFENFRNYAFPPAVFVLRMLSRDKSPPMMGKMPVGSGELRSLNHRIPSVKMAGLILKLYDMLLIMEM